MCSFQYFYLSIFFSTFTYYLFVFFYMFLLYDSNILCVLHCFYFLCCCFALPIKKSIIAISLLFHLVFSNNSVFHNVALFYLFLNQNIITVFLPFFFFHLIITSIHCIYLFNFILCFLRKQHFLINRINF